MPKLRERELFETDYTTNEVRPRTAIESMMQNPTLSIPKSVEEVAEITDLIAYCVELLTDDEVLLLAAILREKLTFDELGERLGVSRTQAWRRFHNVLDRLRYLLPTFKPIRERLNMHPTWQSESMHELVTIAGDAFDDSRLDTMPMENAIYAIGVHIGDAVDAIRDGLEFNAMRSLTAAAEYCVEYLRSVDRWRLMDMHRLLVSKQHDYGHRNILDFGMVGVVMRANDKLARLKNLSGNSVAPRNESLLDSFRDIIGYAVIARMLKNETFELELDYDADEEYVRLEDAA